MKPKNQMNANRKYKTNKKKVKVSVSEKILRRYYPEFVKYIRRQYTNE